MNLRGAAKSSDKCTILFSNFKKFEKLKVLAGEYKNLMFKIRIINIYLKLNYLRIKSSFSILQQILIRQFLGKHPNNFTLVTQISSIDL